MDNFGVKSKLFIDSFSAKVYYFLFQDIQNQDTYLPRLYPYFTEPNRITPMQAQKSMRRNIPMMMKKLLNTDITTVCISIFRVACNTTFICKFKYIMKNYMHTFPNPINAWTHLYSTPPVHMQTVAQSCFLLMFQAAKASYSGILQ